MRVLGDSIRLIPFLHMKWWRKPHSISTSMNKTGGGRVTPSPAGSTPTRFRIAFQLLTREFHRSEALIIFSFDGCWQRGHRGHACTAQSDHSIDVLGAKLGRHIDVPHLGERCE